MGYALTISAGHDIEGEDGLCIDHSERVTRSKARLGCTLTIPSGQEIKSEVGLCMDHSGGSRDRKRGCSFRNGLHT